MNLKDMRRTDWKRITKQEYVSREISVGGIPGRESLIAIRKITSPLTVSSTGKSVKIVDVDYCWLQIALKDSPVWMTVMFDEQGRLLQLYFDITAGNCLDNPENPCFRDMYLDVVLHDTGEIFILDQDELDEALNTGAITQEEYIRTSEACRRLVDYLTQNKDSVIAYCCRSYKELKAMLPQSRYNPSNGGAVMKPGIQVSSFKPILTTPEEVREAFRQISSMGCTTVQLQWIDPSVAIEDISASMKEYGIESVSVQDLYETVRANQDYYIRLNHETGGTWMCVSRIPARLRTIEGLNAYIEELRAFQRELDVYGQKLCFHPVAADYDPIDGIDPVRYLLRNMPELHLCLDLYHVNKRGFSMPEWISEYADRIPMLHFKDETDGQLVPCGQGATDWTGVVSACVQAAIPYAFVEQETWAKDPFISLHESFDWLCAQL